MVSYAYPNVNKHIYSQVPQFRLNTSTNLPVPIPSERVSSLDNYYMESSRTSGMSAPPPYSEEDPSQSGNTFTKSNHVTKIKSKQPSILLEVTVGHRLAKTITNKRQQKQEAKLQRIHDAWMRLGLDTRTIAAQGGQLPPHFWNPPLCSIDEMNAALAKLLP